ncbi:MAG TPA: ATP synthase F1 subunit delta [Kofleriaceae bacterium]|nr:ATP synthase F1 subunit delta [Kofleriaceae bacterium]
MVTGSIARRYARALLDIGKKNGTTESLGREVASLSRAIESSPELSETLANPAFPKSDRERVLTAVLDRIGASKTTKSVTALLLDRERMDIVPDVARELSRMVDEEAGRARAEVTSSAPLSPAAKQRLVRALERLSGKTIEMTVREDASLIAGVIAKLGDTVYDGSLRNQLERMRATLTH